eukprot:NODE_2184_length_970_cov_311.390879_g1797_i0.p1 GENE.NODE_2184_length_970_cov_311.390879_g1797_i0~~NODE_2184_length_970_cov_311.390879_g1797_i0.p1  ORF type:complete len:253 (-),score=84.68 NODE_2184_length_970_cov_311.390879_g1797_i0:210-929(-)
MADEIDKRVAANKDAKRGDVARELVKEILKKHQRIIFNGNGYDTAWHAEAAKRGLPTARNTPEALALMVQPKNKKLFASFGVMDEATLDSRYNVWMEEYITKVDIEAFSFINIGNTMILPAVTNWISELGSSLATAASVVKADTPGPLKQRLATLLELSSKAVAETTKLEEMAHAVHKKEGLEKQAFAGVEVRQQQVVARAAVDALEVLCPASKWPLPSYHRMLFTGQVYEGDVHNEAR